MMSATLFGLLCSPRKASVRWASVYGPTPGSTILGKGLRSNTITGRWVLMGCLRYASEGTTWKEIRHVHSWNFAHR